MDLTCFGIPLLEETCEVLSVTTLVGRRDNLSVTIGPSEVGGWYGYLKLSLPENFYSANEPWADHLTLPSSHIHAETPEEVVRKLESLGGMFLPHFEKARPSVWDRLNSLDWRP